MHLHCFGYRGTSLVIRDAFRRFDEGYDDIKSGGYRDLSLNVEVFSPRNVDIRLPGKRNSNSRGARPVCSFR